MYVIIDDGMSITFYEWTSQTQQFSVITLASFPGEAPPDISMVTFEGAIYAMNQPFQSCTGISTLVMSYNGTGNCWNPVMNSSEIAAIGVNNDGTLFCLYSYYQT